MNIKLAALVRTNTDVKKNLKKVEDSHILIFLVAAEQIGKPRYECLSIVS